MGKQRMNIYAFNALLEAVRGDEVKHKIAHELDAFVAFIAVGPTVNLNIGSEGAGLRIQDALVIGNGLAIVANAADRVIEFAGAWIEAVQLDVALGGAFRSVGKHILRFSFRTV